MSVYPKTLSHREIINKLSVLEYVLGPRKYTILERLPSKSILNEVDLHNAAIQMTYHLGLVEYVPVIKLVSEKPNTAGHINLGPQAQVGTYEICISNGLLFNPDGALAVLAHEICHKLLQVKGFKGRTEEENEFYTDLATIYTGLGKYTLVGCLKNETHFSGNQITTHTESVGYLTRDNYAYAYTLTSYFYGLSRSEYIKGLSSGLRRTIRFVRLPKFTVDSFLRTIYKKKSQCQASLNQIHSMPGKWKRSEFVFSEKIRKYEYANDVINGKLFPKPITAYSLILEPHLWGKHLIVRLAYFVCYPFIHKR